MQTPLKIADSDKISESDLKELKSWLTTQPHLPTIPDNMLHVFHHSCFHDINKTKKCIDTYYTIRESTPEVFKNRNVKDKSLEVAVDNITLNMLPKRTPEGYQIIFERIESTDSSKYNFEDACKLFFMALDPFIHKEGIVPGYIILLDYKNIRLGHLTKTSIESMKKMFRYLQEGAPVRLQAIHMINMNYFVEKVVSFVKPFMAKQLFELIHFHPEGHTDKLYSFVPLECLPKDYEGDQPSSEVMKKEMISEMENNYPYFKEEDKAFPINESLRPNNKKNKKKNDDGISEISLKSLDID